MQDLLDPLRLGVEKYIPRKNPYRYLGTAASWDHEELRQAFAEATVVELGDKETRRRQTAVSPMASPGLTSVSPSMLPSTPLSDIWTFKLTKIGVVNRKGR